MTHDEYVALYFENETKQQEILRAMNDLVYRPSTDKSARNYLVYRPSIDESAIAKPEIKKVIFNDPATIVMWSDGTKTIVKADAYDVFDPEKGLAMAIAKKYLGNNGSYYNIFVKWLPAECLVKHNDEEFVDLLRDLLNDRE